MAIHFDLNDLIAFRAVAELQSFRRAAESVHISQPAFSRRIDKLEQALGVRLLDRTTRRVHLTAVGRDFAHKVRFLLDEIDGTLLALRGIAATRMGDVAVACVPSTVTYFLSQVIRDFHAQYPRVRVRVLDAGANEVLAAVARGDADFGLDFIGSLEPEIDFRSLLQERFVAACRHDHPLAARRSVTWADLAQHDYIAAARSSGNRLLLDQALARAGARPQPIFEAEHVTTMIGMVEAGLGVAVVPAMAMPRGDHPLLVSLTLTQPAVTRRIGLLRRKGRTLSPAAQALYDALLAARRNAAVSRAATPAPGPPSPPTGRGNSPGRTTPPARRGRGGG